MKVTGDDVAQALMALGRSEAFAWLAQRLDDGQLLADVCTKLEALAQEESELAATVADMLKEKSHA